MSKSLITVLVIGVLAVAMILAFVFRGSLGALLSTPEPAAPVATPASQASTYATTTFSIEYPAGYTLNANYAYDQFAGKPIAGVSLTVPTSFATGTNLAADTRISVEQLPRANNCTGDIFIPANVTAREVLDAGLTYSFASTTGAGAGNLYEEIVYAVASSKPCTAVRYYIHSAQINNYPAGAVRPFDREALMAQFDAIRRSLKTN